MIWLPVFRGIQTAIIAPSEARLRMSNPKDCHPKPALPEGSSVGRNMSDTSIVLKSIEIGLTDLHKIS